MDSSANIAKLIEAEQAGIADADAKAASLRIKRGDLLVNGTDKDIDRCEDELGAITRKRDRHAERVEVLTAKRAEAVEAERRASLAALAKRAAKAKAQGEKLIGEYGRQATEMAGTLRKLHALEQFCHRANNELQEGGADGVSGPNIARCVWREKQPDRAERRLVNVDHPQHPDHGAEIRQSTVGGPGGASRHFRVDTGKTVEPVEIDEVIPGQVVTDLVDPLPTTVFLPRLRAGQIDIWSERIAAQSLAELDTTLRELNV